MLKDLKKWQYHISFSWPSYLKLKQLFWKDSNLVTMEFRGNTLQIRGMLRLISPSASNFHFVSGSMLTGWDMVWPFFIFRRKNAAKRDNAGAVCNTSIGMFFYVFDFLAECHISVFERNSKFQIKRFRQQVTYRK